MTISPERAVTTSSPLVLLPQRIVLLKPITPLDLASTLEAMTAREAAPPMWKGRLVSCVPGSPIDWAAVPPTGSAGGGGSGLGGRGRGGARGPARCAP